MDDSNEKYYFRRFQEMKVTMNLEVVTLNGTKMGLVLPLRHVVLPAVIRVQIQTAVHVPHFT